MRFSKSLLKKQKLIIYTFVLFAVLYLAMGIFRWLFGSINVTYFEYSPIVPPIFALYLLKDLKGGVDWGKEQLLSASILAVMFFILTAYSYHQVWMQQDTIYFIPFFIGYFGLAHSLFLFFFSKRFLKKNKKHVFGFASIIAILFACFLMLQYKWEEIASLVTFTLGGSMQIFTDAVSFHAEQNLISLNHFMVYIGISCTGVTSMLLFSSIYGLMAWDLEAKKILERVHAIVGFVIGVLTMFALNLFRIGMILLLGAYVSPKLAEIAFHNIAGVILFLAVTILYVKIVLKWLILPREKSL